MTALEKFARLEGPGVWREGPDRQRQNVIVTVGKATLMISDPRTGVALSHWSLPAVTRVSRGTEPARYAPGPDDTDETLDIDDLTLIEALERIADSLRPHPPARWLRRALAVATFALFLGGGLVLPGALERHTAEIVPPAMRTQIGREALEALAVSPAGERVCAQSDGRQALASLRERILGSDWRLQVVAGVPGFETAHLPGRLILVSGALVERLDSPEALAGWILAEAERAEATDPLIDVLDYAGLRATVTLLTTGALPEGALMGYARARMEAARAPFAPAEVLRARLESVGVSPYAFALSLRGIDDALAQALTEGSAPQVDPVITDGAWLTLQAICTR